MQHRRCEPASARQIHINQSHLGYFLFCIAAGPEGAMYDLSQEINSGAAVTIANGILQGSQENCK
jgi:hypothetical protein